MAYMGVYLASMFSSVERNVTKPFNPILGETYELVTDGYEFLAEQVSHHPPVTASFCKGRKSNYEVSMCQKSNLKVTLKSVEFHQQYRAYVYLKDWNETYEITMPILSLHNFIIGTMYIDMSGTCNIRILGNNEL